MAERDDLVAAAEMVVATGMHKEWADSIDAGAVAVSEAYLALVTPRPLAEWQVGHGAVLWWSLDGKGGLYPPKCFNPTYFSVEQTLGKEYLWWTPLPKLLPPEDRP